MHHSTLNTQCSLNGNTKATAAAESENSVSKRFPPVAGE